MRTPAPKDLIIALAIVTSLTGAAWGSGPGKASAKRMRPEPAESHKFADLKLKGQLKKPEMSYIYKRNGLRAEKIVDIPENFDNEIIQDASRF